MQAFCWPSYWRTVLKNVVAPSITIISKTDLGAFVDQVGGYIDSITSLPDSTGLLLELQTAGDGKEALFIMGEYLMDFLLEPEDGNPETNKLLRITRSLQNKSAVGSRTKWEKAFVNFGKVLKKINFVKTYTDAGWNLSGTLVSMKKLSGLGTWTAYCRDCESSPEEPLSILSIHASPTTVTVGEVIEFSAVVSGGSGEYTYEWIINESPFSLEENFTFTFGSLGLHSVALMVSDANSAEQEIAHIEVTVIENEPPPEPDPNPNSDTVTNSLGMAFVKIPAGTFMMGSPSNEPGRDSNETQHQVTLTQSFYMQTTEVTQGQWEAVMGSNPSIFANCGDDCPVERVSWNDVQNFIEEMNKRGEGTYALPTETQWEYSARAGSTTTFANGDITETGCGYDPNLDLMGWYCGNSGNKIHPVAQKEPNVWGLYDMHGNVFEWCQGEYSSNSATDPVGPSTGSLRVFRGGRWSGYAQFCRSAYRYGIWPGYRSHSLGFRLVLSPGDSPNSDDNDGSVEIETDIVPSEVSATATGITLNCYVNTPRGNDNIKSVEFVGEFPGMTTGWALDYQGMKDGHAHYSTQIGVMLADSYPYRLPITFTVTDMNGNTFSKEDNSLIVYDPYW